MYTKFWWGNLKEREGTDWIDLAQDRNRPGGTCECVNEPSDSIKCGEFLD